MITVTAQHEGIDKTLSVKQWAVVTGTSTWKIRYRLRIMEARQLSPETVVGLSGVGLKPCKFNQDRENSICGSYHSGLTFQEIATIHKVTNQRIWQILKRNGITYQDSPRNKRNRF